MAIADVIAHAMDPRLLLSLDQQVEELEAILVEFQADLADHEKVHEETQKLELTSRIFLPEHNQRPRARIQCGTVEI